ncbi:hypothetical protein NPIL_27541 [Nephila pilipes]|uniref:Uncharacterized protein n=1 Tax=Nephila pilipes TaxID=299642 RepID=A0A8X6TZ45_NEPPI|nr:hypothetical protein NPIL_27541 [Nephila pilipes]
MSKTALTEVPPPVQKTRSEDLMTDHETDPTTTRPGSNWCSVNSRALQSSCFLGTETADISWENESRS